MKQTAVEWLVKELVELDKQLDGRRNNEDATVFKINPTKIYQQAKQIEKELINEAFNESRKIQDSDDISITYDWNNSEQYYNKTYGKDNGI